MSIVFRRAFVLSAHRRSLLRNNTPAHSRTFATIMADWVHVPATGAGDSLVSSYSIFTKPIEKSQQDDRDYRLIRLENGLEALLVHDAKADKAAASLDVSVGHLADPDDMPGLAHFCEHLLFMGTQTFPKENEYAEFLAKNNGASNAYTSISNTNYYFNVATTALPGALARFAGFFHCPLFAPSCTSRELNAVDSEHKKNHQNDMWRIYQVNKHLSKPGHVWKKFGSGHRESLSQAAKDLKAQGKLGKEGTSTNHSLAPSPIPSRISSPAPSVSSTSSDQEADGGAIGRETRRRVVEWWEDHYSAERMRLCVVGKESLDDLSALVSQLFSPVLNKGREPLTMIYDHPFGPNEKGTIVDVHTIMSFYALEMSFPLEWQAPLWQTKPAHFISHLVGHEGPGSLHSYLKQKGWITDLSCGPQSLATGFDMFRVTVYLTLEGFKNYSSVLLAAFKYFSLLRNSQFPPYHQDEQVTLDAIRFRFKEKGRPDDYASGLAARMFRPAPRDLLLTAHGLTFPWAKHEDPAYGEKKVREYLNQFTPEGGRVVLMAKEDVFKSVDMGSNEPWEHEPWYGTSYRVRKFDELFIKEAKGPNDILDLYLPTPNEFIPKNLDVEKKDGIEPLKRPHLIRETALSSLWHKKDDRFWVPKAYVILDLRSPFANESARSVMLTRLFADLVTDSLTEYSYDASLAGLSYHFSPHTMGIFITMNGYNDKMSVLAQHVLEKGKGLVVDPERFAVVKEEVKRSLDNFFLSQSFKISDFYGRYLLTERGWSVEERREELASITPEEVQAFIAKLFSEVNARILVTGNIRKEEAIKIAELTEQGLGKTSKPILALNERGLRLPEGSNFVWTSDIANPNEPNSALTYYVNYGPTSDQRLRVTAALVSQILKEPAFNTLRTQEQLGYAVFCSPWMLPGSTEHGLRIVVQSERSPKYCEARVEAFLDTMKKAIEEMSEELFQEQKAGLEKKWREAVKNLAEETAQYNVHIDSGYLDFLRNEEDANIVQSVTKEEVLALFLSKVHSSSPTRAKLSVHMQSKKPRPQKVSPAAAEAFQQSVAQLGLSAEEQNWKDALGEEPPTLTAFGQFWMKALGEKGAELLSTIPALLEKYPYDEESSSPLRTNIQYISDAKAFRSSLQPTFTPQPIEWGDLPLPKL